MNTSQLRLTRFFSEKNALYLILIVSLVGIIFSSFLLYSKYNPNPYCIVNGFWDCGEVSQSKWSEILGIPVALIGLIGFTLIFVFSLIRLTRPTERNELLVALIFLLSIVGTGFGIYLTCIEIFVIGKVCPYCLLCFILMIIIIILITLLFFGLREELTASEEGDDDAEDADES